MIQTLFFLTAINHHIRLVINAFQAIPPYSTRGVSTVNSPDCQNLSPVFCSFLRFFAHGHKLLDLCAKAANCGARSIAPREFLWKLRSNAPRSVRTRLYRRLAVGHAQPLAKCLEPSQGCGSPIRDIAERHSALRRRCQVAPVANFDFFPGLSRRNSMVSFASLWIF
jgi:hypothetical protein